MMGTSPLFVIPVGNLRLLPPGVGAPCLDFETWASSEARPVFSHPLNSTMS